MAILPALDRLLTSLEKVTVALSSLALFVMMALVTVDALTRYVIKVTLPDVYHFSELYLMPTIFFLALANTQKLGGNVAVELLENRLPGGLSAVIKRVSLLLTAVIAGLAAYAAFPMAWQHIIEWRVTGGEVPWPTGLSRMIVPIGFGLLALRLFLQVVNSKGR